MARKIGRALAPGEDDTPFMCDDIGSIGRGASFGMIDMLVMVCVLLTWTMREWVID